MRSMDVSGCQARVGIQSVYKASVISNFSSLRLAAIPGLVPGRCRGCNRTFTEMDRRVVIWIRQINIDRKGREPANVLG